MTNTPTPDQTLIAAAVALAGEHPFTLSCGDSDHRGLAEQRERTTTHIGAVYLLGVLEGRLARLYHLGLLDQAETEAAQAKVRALYDRHLSKLPPPAGEPIERPLK